MRKETALSACSDGDLCPPGRRISDWVRASSTPGRKPSTTSPHSAGPSTGVDAWYQPTGGSNGNGRAGPTALFPGTRRRITNVVRSAVEQWPKGGASLESFTIITTAASPGLTDIHHRQPAIINPEQFGDWLDPKSPVPRLLDLVREPHSGPYERRPISARVNDVRNDDPDILDPLRQQGLFDPEWRKSS